ncbi:hypothetical protein C8N24_0287 [Solirubrobacter pauli]|uniref:Uncharacterized protein n=1 Tax=Solirubrobacter pauli TaxID=166793 RepID=A0A660L613_9ACTN|nr:hypothetical protein C8N24_0287 [Solirubrobacter pauli]
MKPTLGSTVIYRSKTGNYDLAAIVTATADTLWPEGVERRTALPRSGPVRSQRSSSVCGGIGCSFVCRGRRGGAVGPRRGGRC